MKGSAAQVARARPAAAHGMLVRGSLNVSNLRMISADASFEISASFALPRSSDRLDKGKSEDRSQS
jgi:hypothetical protein